MRWVCGQSGPVDPKTATWDVCQIVQQTRKKNKTFGLCWNICRMLTLTAYKRTRITVQAYCQGMKEMQKLRGGMKKRTPQKTGKRVGRAKKRFKTLRTIRNGNIAQRIKNKCQTTKPDLTLYGIRTVYLQALQYSVLRSASPFRLSATVFYLAAALGMSCSSPTSPNMQTLPKHPLRPSSRLIALTLTLALLLPLLLLLSHPQITPIRLVSLPQQNSSESSSLTIGIKTYVCDSITVSQVLTLLSHIRLSHPTIPILLANDGPLALSAYDQVTNDPYVTELQLPIDSGISVGRNRMVNHTETEYFMLLDDDHLWSPDGTDVSKMLTAMTNFDIVGIRVMNLPGIPELEDAGIHIPRYVANVTKFKDRIVQLCVWDENAGPSVVDMKEPVKVDVVHNALIARTEALRQNPWRDQLKVNEHMTFFLDARNKTLRVGYLPSAYVFHRPRKPSNCYQRVRQREDVYERLLDYRDDFAWTKGCYNTMPAYVRWHLAHNQ